MNNFAISRNILFGLGLVAVLSLVIFNSFYKLSESPATWTDEGLILQTAQNLAGQGVYGFQIAPKTLISPSFISTSYPVTFPIYLSFSLFGVSLLHARGVMALYIIALFIAVFFLFRHKAKEELLWTLLLVGSFPPLYGHGKNVLGEIPGLFFLLMSAFFLKSTEDDRSNLVKWLFFGLFFGLAIATKPIFILAVPAFLFVLYKTQISHKSIDFKKLGVIFIFSFIPFLIWFNVQFFSTDSWSSIVSYYSNPHALRIIPAILLNLKDFFTHAQTLFALGIFTLWSLAFGHSYYKSKHIPLYQSYLYIISFFVFMFYFRNPPYYRYFLISEVLSLMFLSFNLFDFSQNKVWLRNTARVTLLSLVVLGLYGLYFNSWVANSYGSTKTMTMENVIGQIPDGKTVFFYQAPEAVVFLKHFDYYQYFSGTVATEFGGENLSLIRSQNDLLIITRKDLFSQRLELFSDYHITQEFDRYVLATK